MMPKWKVEQAVKLFNRVLDPINVHEFKSAFESDLWDQVRRPQLCISLWNSWYYHPGSTHFIASAGIDSAWQVGGQSWIAQRLWLHRETPLPASAPQLDFVSLGVGATPLSESPKLLLVRQFLKPMACCVVACGSAHALELIRRSLFFR